jgi:hypothetical protein
VGGAVGAAVRCVRVGERRVGGEDRIERRVQAGAGLAEDAEAAREAVGSSAAMARPIAVEANGYGERWTRRPKRSRRARPTPGNELAPPTT